MGIKNLWPFLVQAGMPMSILKLSTNEGFVRNYRGRRTLLVGVDASILLESCVTALNGGADRHARAGENAHLRIFFFKLCEFLKAPVTLIFVFDGPHRPTIKRGQNVIDRPNWFYEYAKTLIEAFGFYWCTAPGEAEAQLAKLNSLHIIDAIITTDSDTFVFGAHCVLRPPDPKDRSARKSYQMYTSDVIENMDSGLSEGGLLLVALTSGGDYDPGLPNCGPLTAIRLAQCGFGDTLLSAAKSKPRAELEVFLCQWRYELRSELQTNSRGFLRTRNEALATHITDSFPNLEVLDHYVNPRTSWSTNNDTPIPDASAWIPREPTIHKITQFCVDRFGWTHIPDILKRFEASLWPGVAFRMVCSPYRQLKLDGNNRRILTPTTAADVLVWRQKPRHIADAALSPIILWTIKVTTDNFASLTGLNVGCIVAQPISFYVPQVMLTVNGRMPHALPPHNVQSGPSTIRTASPIPVAPPHSAGSSDKPSRADNMEDEVDKILTKTSTVAVQSVAGPSRACAAATLPNEAIDLTDFDNTAQEGGMTEHVDSEVEFIGDITNAEGRVVIYLSD